jgi:hypothetical protein
MTKNHSYNRPEEGELNWHLPINENFEKLDTDVEIRDQYTKIKEYTPSEGAKFLSIDTEEAYIGDGNQWNKLDSTGKDPRVSSLLADSLYTPSRSSSAIVRTEGSKYIADGDFGEISSGTDASSVLQAANDKIHSEGGGSVYLKPGTYTLTSTISGSPDVSWLSSQGTASWNRDSHVTLEATSDIGWMMDLHGGGPGDPNVHAANRVSGIHFKASDSAKYTTSGLLVSTRQTLVERCKFEHLLHGAGANSVNQLWTHNFPRKCSRGIRQYSGGGESRFIGNFGTADWGTTNGSGNRDGWVFDIEGGFNIIAFNRAWGDNREPNRGGFLIRNGPNRLIGNKAQDFHPGHQGDTKFGMRFLMDSLFSGFKGGHQIIGNIINNCDGGIDMNAFDDPPDESVLIGNRFQAPSITPTQPAIKFDSGGSQSNDNIVALNSIRDYSTAISGEGDNIFGQNIGFSTTRELGAISTSSLSTKLSGINNVTSSRSLDTDYQNTTGRDIWVEITMGTDDSADKHNYELRVAGDQSKVSNNFFRAEGFDMVAEAQYYIRTIVPNGYWYRLVAYSDNDATIQIWHERGVSSS